jgi:hypothetical protein
MLGPQLGHEVLPERGDPLGALPGIGYELERRIVENRPVSRRIVSPTTAPFAVASFERVAVGRRPALLAGGWTSRGSERSEVRCSTSARSAR